MPGENKISTGGQRYKKHMCCQTTEIFLALYRTLKITFQNTTDYAGNFKKRH